MDNVVKALFSLFIVGMVNVVVGAFLVKMVEGGLGKILYGIGALVVLFCVVVTLLAMLVNLWVPIFPWG